MGKPERRLTPHPLPTGEINSFPSFSLRNWRKGEWSIHFMVVGWSFAGSAHTTHCTHLIARQPTAHGLHAFYQDLEERGILPEYVNLLSPERILYGFYHDPETLSHHLNLTETLP